PRLFGSELLSLNVVEQPFCFGNNGGLWKGYNFPNASLDPAQELHRADLVLVRVGCTGKIPHVTDEIELLIANIRDEPNFVGGPDEIEVINPDEISFRFQLLPPIRRAH